jgi:outer membrane protein assembly factor BamB
MLERMRANVNRGVWGMLLCLAAAAPAIGADQDWPMWRYDAYRSAAAPANSLPGEFRLLWSKEISPRQQAWDDPLNLDLMTYDRIFEPIVMGGRLFVGFNDRDKLVALNADSGEELWASYAEGPVRLPPTGSAGRVYFCSDDGFLYCVDAVSGKTLWKFRGAPNSQHAIGNSRIVSAWPARGGAVIRDNTVYFAASIWPFMGTFIYALDAETGEVQWVNDQTGSQYIKQPHSAPSFAGVGPQGALLATKEMVLVPGGRSVPAAFDRATGELRYFEINAGGKGTGGSFVSADEKQFYVHTRNKGTRAFHLHSGIKTAFMPSEPVLHDGKAYSAEGGEEKRVIRAYQTDGKLLWEVAADGSGDLILAGEQLVAAGATQITVLRLAPNGPPIVTHTIPIQGKVERLLVADRKVFAVDLSGRISAFGAVPSNEEVAGPTASPQQRPQSPVADTERMQHRCRELLEAGDAEGYALWFGRSDSAELRAMSSMSPFVELVVVDTDLIRIEGTRRALDEQGLYGRVTVRHSEPLAFRAPRYVAHMVFVDAELSSRIDSSSLRAIYESVRPYGGVLHLLSNTPEQTATAVAELQLENAKIELGKESVIVRRQGALPGSADWTHQNGDVANSIKSNDSRVKLPLGVLWFGGSSNMDVLPRHGHGPTEQVIGGRLFIQGINSLSARDVYTGRVLWKKEFKDLGTYDVYYDETYSDVPLDPKYNQVHIPGANGRGTNYVATEDRIYIIEGSVCHVLDPATGELLSDFRLTQNDPERNSAGGVEVAEPQWGYIGVYKDVLIGGEGFANYRQRHEVSLESDADLSANRAGYGAKSFDRAASVALVGMDRHTGEVLWRVQAKHSFWHNGIVAGGDKIYALDRNPAPLEAVLRRRGIAVPETYRIVGFDYRGGQIVWEIQEGIFGTWLGYSEPHDLLLQAGAAGSDRLSGEVSKGMAVYTAADGKVKWKNDSLKYTGPCILHNDLIIANTNSYSDSAGAFNLLDGKQKQVPNPLTGQAQPWKLSRAYGCNNILASENLLTFRSGAAGFYDLTTDSGTGNLGGFKSGCTSNLVVANGVLNAPDYTRTCSCAYQNQTSLALVHMPEVELWSVNSSESFSSKDRRIERVGINFGAPGDRRDSNGLLWLEYPAVAGPSPLIDISFNDDATFFRRHSSAVVETDTPWIFASGADGVTDLRIGLTLRDDMALVQGIPVGHANDDATEASNGKVNLTSDAVLGKKTSLVGLRFNKITLSPDAVIREAYIQFTGRDLSTEMSTMSISAEDSGNAKRFSATDHDISARTFSAESVSWSAEPWTTINRAEVVHRSPNLAPLLEGIIRREDWKSGNSVAFAVTGVGQRNTWSFGSGHSRAPRLVILLDHAAQDAAEELEKEEYTVRLFFAIPQPAVAQDETSQRKFGLSIQGQAEQEITLRRPDAVEPGGKSTAYLVHEQARVSIGTALQLKFSPREGVGTLSGVEIVRDSAR